MNVVEDKARTAASWAAGDDGATWTFRLALVLTIPVFYFVGRRQWFTRDDWAYVLSREAVRANSGWQHWLFDAQDGHWLTIPVLVFHFTREIFGLGSYWPFLLPAMASHVVAVLLTREVCKRLRVSPWNTTIVCAMLLVFGSGWDNIVFAIQISYNFSLVFFLAQFLLADHDGPVDRRDVIGAVLGVLGMMSSGFGPIFMVGVFVLLAFRRRWKAVLIAVVPQAVIYGWWLIFWATDNVAAARPGDRAELPAYLARGVSATFEAMVAIPALSGLALLAALGVALWRGTAWRARSMMIALWATLGTMFLAIGWERIGFGVPTAASSRYLHIGAIVIAPVLALAVDQLARLSSEARWAARIVLVMAVAVNASALRTNSSRWAQQARAEQDTFSLVAGSPEVLAVPVTRVMSPFSPNVTIQWIPTLISWNAITPRHPRDEREHHHVLVALGLAPPDTEPPSP